MHVKGDESKDTMPTMETVTGPREVGYIQKGSDHQILELFSGIKPDNLSDVIITVIYSSFISNN